MTARVLIAGGARDPNLDSLQLAAERARIDCVSLRIRSEAPPALDWKQGASVIGVDGAEHAPDAVFCRHDVFDALASGRPELGPDAYAWFCAVTGWTWAQDRVACFNRHMHFRAINKIAVLAAAQAAGLAVPESRFTNSRLAAAQLPDGSIAKPIDGGGYCQPLANIVGRTRWQDDKAAAPAILQPQLEYPEYRVYVVGKQTMAFRVYSEQLDYRRDHGANIELLEQGFPEDVAANLVKLAESLGLDFGAADLKTDPRTGTPVFLELNTAPMFAAFDSISGGRLTDLMIASLCSQRNN